MWDMSSHSCLISLGGHQHRLTWVDFQPGQSSTKFVTASLDSSLKVWDFAAVSAGKVPPVGGLHYISLSVSPNQEHMACSQGWASQCELFEVESNSSVGSAASHNGFIQQTAFSPDSVKLVSVDTGHRGAYEVTVLGLFQKLSWGAPHFFQTPPPPGHTWSQSPPNLRTVL